MAILRQQPAKDTAEEINIEELQRQVDEAKRSIATHEGVVLEARRRLKEEFGLGSAEEAEAEIAALEAKIPEMEKNVQRMKASLRENYSW